MIYNVSSLTKVSECDSLLGFLGKEKDDLNFEMTNLKRQANAYLEKSVSVNADHQSVKAELEALRKVEQTLPDGPSKIEYQKKIIRLEYKEFLLSDRSDDFGVVSVVNKQYELAIIESTLAETDKLILEVQARKTALGGS